MKIGIIGTGPIGSTLALTLSSAGHDVKVANSRGPETISHKVLSAGAKASTVEEALFDRDVIILSIPFGKIPEIKPLFDNVSESTVVIDTSNYYPSRDNQIEAIESGQVESLWVREQLQRPIAKAWNAIGAPSFATKGKPAGTEGRIAIPIAADRDKDKEATIKLVSDSGLDAFDAGTLSESWRQQPGSPVYCTDLTIQEIPAALNSAQKERISKRRDIAVSVVSERSQDWEENYPPADFLVQLNRLLFM